MQVAEVAKLAAGIVAAILLVLVAGYQLLLAAGKPWGAGAWGGQHRVLPIKLRWASVTAAGVLALATWVALARADLVAPGSHVEAVRIATWILAAQFALNTLGNLASKSTVERRVMTPVTLLLLACFLVLALS